MIPRISKTVAHKKLYREFGIISPPPKKSHEYWQIFKELHRSPAFGKQWRCELLFLSKQWQSYLDSDDPAWLNFKNYLLYKTLKHSELARNKVVLDILWQILASDFTAKNLKPDPYVLDTLRHLLYITLGGASGMTPTVNNESGPVERIQQIYTDIYGLKDQFPTLLQPQHFSYEDGKPVYYSMQTPTLLTTTPSYKNLSSTIENMRELVPLAEYILFVLRFSVFFANFCYFGSYESFKSQGITSYLQDLKLS